LSKEEVDKKISSGEPYVIRFKSPNEKEVLLNDIVRGEISIDSKTLDDKILFKSDGMPTYHLANVVDDHLMEISHVIRGEEWLPSLALHKLLYDALGWEPPEFAHLPLILKPTGKGKLSKRDGDKLGFPVFPLEWINNGSRSAGFKESGYLPEALINFLSFLGWNPGTEEEIFSMESLINSFSLSKVNKAGARFDTEKIKWFNQHYISNKKNSVLANFLASNHNELKSTNKDRIAHAVGLIKDRANLLTDLWPLSCYFFMAPSEYDEKGIKKAWKAESGKIMSSFSETLIEFDDSSPESLKKDFEGWIKTKKIGFGSVVMPLRLAIVGALKGADIFDIIHSIGKNETVSRIKRLKDQVQTN
jgi:glutamyl-tRNA synthetase